MISVENKVFTTAPKSGKRKRSPSPVRERCIQFRRVLNELGYDKTVTLDKAQEIFRIEMGIMDSKSLRAYFGVRAGKSKRTISMMKRYPLENKA